MNKKKLIAILLGLIWLILLIDRFFLSDNKSAYQPSLQGTRQTIQKDEKSANTKKDVTYPQLRLALTRKDLFSSPFQTMAEKQAEKETKKVITLPAPPLPILPEPKKPEQTQKPEEKQDPLKELSLIGVLEKRPKTLAFIKYKKEIKPFSTGQSVFDTNFFVEKIGVNVVILKNKANEEIKLELEKEEKHDKK